MPNFAVPNLEYVRRKDPRLGEALEAIEKAVNITASQSNVSAQGNPQAPSAPTSLSVVSQGGGIVAVTISDQNTGVYYAVEYSATPQFNGTIFQNPPVTAKSFLISVGTGKTFYFRAHSYRQPTLPSTLVYFGGPDTPTAVSA